MSKTSPLISSFTGGEISPLAYGRADTDLYKVSSQTIDNFIIDVRGPIKKRPGTRYVFTVKYPTKDTRVISYVYGETIAYILEFGDEYMRVYRDGGQVQVSGIAYEISTPFTDSDIFDIKFVQSADVMYMAHPDHPPQKLIRYADDSWTISDVDIVNGPFMDENTTTTYYLTASDITGDISVTASGFAPFLSTDVGSIWRFTSTIRNSATITTDNSFTDSVEADSGENIFVELDGTWVSGTVTLQRSVDAGTNWFDYEEYTTPTSTTITEYEDDVIYRLGVKTGDFGTGSISATLGKLNQYGYFEITGYTSSTQVSATVQKTLPTTSTTKWSEGAWSDTNGYPRAIAFFEEKLVFAGTYFEPQTIWFSQTDDYENFESGTTLADALTITLASNNINIIQWLLDSQQILHVGTIGSEWQIETQEAFPFVTASRQSPVGSNYIQGIPVERFIFYIQKGGKKLRQRYYWYDNDTWVSDEISTSAEHLFEDGIYDITYINEPDPLILMTRSDGVIVCHTFSIPNKVSGFSTWTTDGSFESTTSIPGTDRDEIWSVVKRTTSSGTYTRFIEQFQTTKWTNQEDAWYVDSGLQYLGNGATTFSGIDHLSGISIVPTTSGAVLPNETVSATGSFVLDEEYPNVIAGLPFTSKLQTMELEAGSDFGTAQNKHKALAYLSIKLYQSLGLKVGHSFDDLTIIPFRDSSDPMGAPPALFTGFKREKFPYGYARDTVICVQSDQPCPCTILALVPEVQTNDY